MLKHPAYSLAPLTLSGHVSHKFTDIMGCMRLSYKGVFENVPPDFENIFHFVILIIVIALIYGISVLIYCLYLNKFLRLIY